MLRSEIEWIDRRVDRHTGTRRRVVVLLTLAAARVAGAASDATPPTPPGGLVASEITATGMTIGWGAATDNVRVTGYEIFKDGAAGGTTAGLSKAFASLTPNTQYTFSVRARDAKGNWSPQSSALTVATTPDVTAPAQPSGLVASAVRLTGFLVAWDAAPDDVKTIAYEVFVDGVSLGIKPGRSHNVNGLTPGATYMVAVRAGDAAGNWSAMSEAMPVKTLADVTPPSVPDRLEARSVGATKFVLKWSPSKDDVGVRNYEIFRDGSSLGTTTAKSFSVVRLLPLTNYRMTVRAGDEAGNWSAPSAELSVMTIADSVRPSVPDGLVVTSSGASGFSLRWDPSKDNVGVVEYEVLVGGIVAGRTSATHWTVSGLQLDTAYVVRIRARDAAGNLSGRSRALTVRTAQESPLGSPSAPTALSGRTAAGGFVLSWTASSGGVGELTYEVSIDGAVAGSTHETSLILAGLEPGVNHQLTVRARDTAGRQSELSAAFDALIPKQGWLVGFEPDEGYQTGPLDQQGDWNVVGSAEVVATDVPSGRQSLVVPTTTAAAGVTHTFPVGDTGIAFVDFLAKPSAGLTAEDGVFFETAAGALALVRTEGSAELQVLDGDGHGAGFWRSATGMVSLDENGRSVEWLRLSLRLDHAAKQWDLYRGAQPIATGLGFVQPAESANALTFGGGTAGPGGIDALLVSEDNPMFEDRDRDGIDDEWEVDNGLDPARDDRLDDNDGDGLSNLEEYMGLVDPRKADTDGDGIPDGVEVGWGMDPRSPLDATRDNDGDGRTNLQEFAAGTNPWDYFNGRAFVVVSPPGTGRATYAYDASGRISRAAYGDGRALDFEFDPAGNLTRLLVSASGAIEDWRRAHGLPPDGTGLGADDAVLEDDGLPTLAKYAFGLDPRARAVGEFPAIGIRREGSNSYLTLTYCRPEPALSDIDYTVEVSADGTTWLSGDDATETISKAPSSGLATVTVRDRTPTTEGTAARQIRLRIERKISS